MDTLLLQYHLCTSSLTLGNACHQEAAGPHLSKALLKYRHQMSLQPAGLEAQLDYGGLCELKPPQSLGQFSNTTAQA